MGVSPDGEYAAAWYSHEGRTRKARAQPGGAALALNVVRSRPGRPADLVIVPARGAGTLLQDVTRYRRPDYDPGGWT